MAEAAEEEQGEHGRNPDVHHGRQAHDLHLGRVFRPPHLARDVDREPAEDRQAADRGPGRPGVVHAESRAGVDPFFVGGGDDRVVGVGFAGDRPGELVEAVDEATLGLEEENEEHGGEAEHHQHPEAVHDPRRPAPTAGQERRRDEDQQRPDRELPVLIRCQIVAGGDQRVVAADEPDRGERRPEPDGDEGQGDEGDREDHPRGPEEGRDQPDYRVGDAADEDVVTTAARDRGSEQAVTDADRDRDHERHRHAEPDRAARKGAQQEEDRDREEDRGRLPCHVEDEGRERGNFPHQAGGFSRVGSLRHLYPDTRYWLITRSGARCTKQPSRWPLP